MAVVPRDQCLPAGSTDHFVQQQRAGPSVILHSDHRRASILWAERVWMSTLLSRRACPAPGKVGPRAVPFGHCVHLAIALQCAREAGSTIAPVSPQCLGPALVHGVRHGGGVMRERIEQHRVTLRRGLGLGGLRLLAFGQPRERLGLSCLGGALVPLPGLRVERARGIGRRARPAPLIS